MINQVVLIGRIVKNIDDDSKYMIIAVSRSYKNENGEYETDLIDVFIKGHIAEATKEYCHEGDLIGVRGFVETIVKDEIRYTNIIANKISFLSNTESNSRKY